MLFTAVLHAPSLRALCAKRRIESERSGRQWRCAAQARTAEETNGRREAAPARVSDRAKRKGKSDQRKRERGKSHDRCAMQRALVMLVLLLRGCGGAVRMVHAN